MATEIGKDNNPLEKIGGQFDITNQAKMLPESKTKKGKDME